MFVVSVEGPNFINRHTWSTHKVLGIFNTREEAIAEYAIESDEPVSPEGMDDKDEFENLHGEDTIIILTDLSSGEAERIN